MADTPETTVDCCPHCGGEGWVGGYVIGDEIRELTCPGCHGSGVVRSLLNGAA